MTCKEVSIRRGARDIGACKLENTGRNERFADSRAAMQELSYSEKEFLGCVGVNPMTRIGDVDEFKLGKHFPNQRQVDVFDVVGTAATNKAHGVAKWLFENNGLSEFMVVPKDRIKPDLPAKSSVRDADKTLKHKLSRRRVGTEW